MAGAGTAALELIEDAGVVDTLVVPVGGGGLIAGCATIAKELGVERVVGVEPEAGDDWQQSFAAGEIVAIDVPRTIADGLQTHAPGDADLGGRLAARRRDRDGHRRADRRGDALRVRAAEARGRAERRGRASPRVLNGLVSGGRIGVIVSGGNVGAARFAELLA